MKRYLLFFCSLFLFVGAYANPVKWIDTKGKVSYSDTLPSPDFIVRTCQFPLSTTVEMKDVGDRIPPPPFEDNGRHHNPTASRVDPWAPLSLLFGDNPQIDFSTLKTTLLEDAAHGKISAINYGSGIGAYWYFSQPKYVGRDRAIFMAKLNGKHYKIVIDLLVSHTAEEAEAAAYGNKPSWCIWEPQLTKVK